MQKIGLVEMILNEQVMHFLQSKNSTYLWSFVGTPCLLFLGCNYFLVIDNYEVDLILIFLHLIPVTPSWWFKKKNFVWLKGSRSPLIDVICSLSQVFPLILRAINRHAPKRGKKTTSLILRILHICCLKMTALHCLIQITGVKLPMVGDFSFHLIDSPVS